MQGCLYLESFIVYQVDFKELYLNWNKINGEGGAIIIDAIRKHGKMKVLDLSQNYLGTTKSKVMENLLKLIKSSSSKGIVHLDLS